MATGFALALNASAAVEVAGVKFEDRIQVAGGELMLNGAGLRTRAFFKVYAMGLYVPQKRSAPAELLDLKGAKRAHIVLLRDVGADTFAESLIDGLKNNSSDAEYARLKDRAEQFRATILELKEVTKGAVVDLDFLPDSGTRLSVSGQQRGKDIPGEDFYRALLRIWLGEKPVQDDLKQALLGKAGG
jgi:hypothetical protein